MSAWELGVATVLAGVILGFARARNPKRPIPTDAHPLRRRLIDLIRRKPGLRPSKLSDELDANRGTAKYHLIMLERAQLVHAVRAKRVTRYFPADLPPGERPLYALLLRGRVLEVASLIAKNPGISQRELTSTLGLSRKVFRRYADLLVERELLNEVREPHLRRYYATPGLESIIGRLTSSETSGKEEMGHEDEGRRFIL